MAALFGTGTIWAALNGNSVLYIDWLENYKAHHFTDDTNWGLYLGKDYFSDIKNTAVQALEQQGFSATSVGDVPKDLSGYSLVVFEAWFELY